MFNPLTVSVEMIDEALNHFRHSVPISSHRSQVPNPNPSVGPRVIFFLLSSTDSYRLIRPATCRLSQSKFRILLRRLRANAQARFRDLAYFTTLAASPNVICYIWVHAERIWGFSMSRIPKSECKEASCLKNNIDFLGNRLHGVTC